MFWDNSYSTSPHIGQMLNKEDITLTELLDNDEILQEYKSQNKNLVQFFHQSSIILEMIEMITTEPAADLPEATRFKHPNIACEILTTDMPSLTERLVENPSILEKLYSFLEQDPPLHPLLTSFFSKTFGMLIIKKSEQDWFTYQCVCVQLLQFIKTRERFLDDIFKHIGTPAIVDLLFQIIVNVEGHDMKSTLFDWLMHQRLIPRLVNILGCGAESMKHNNVAQFICDIVTHCRSFRQSDMAERGKSHDSSQLLLTALEDEEITHALLEIILTNLSEESTAVAGIKIILKLLEKPQILINERDAKIVQLVLQSEEKYREKLLTVMLPQMSARIKDFHDLLLNPPAMESIQNTVEFLAPPFGNTRLQVCTLFSVLLQTGNSDIEKAICATDFFSSLLALFKQYCWNNLLHNQVKNCLVHVLTPPNNSEVSALQTHVITNSKIISKLIDCWMLNREKMQASKKKGSRFGYMGQLIAICQVVEQNYVANDAYRALVEASIDEDERDSLRLIINTTDGELHEELLLQNRLLAGLDPYCKNDVDFNISTNVIDGEIPIDAESMEQFNQTAMYKINMINVQDLMSNMFTNDGDFDDDNDDDDDDDDDDGGIDNDDGIGEDNQLAAMGDGKHGGGNRAFHDRVILESSDDNANVHSVDKMKETESLFNFYNSHGSSAVGTMATTNEDDFGGGFANFGEVFGDGFGGESFGNDDDFGNNLLADIKFHKNTVQTDVLNVAATEAKASPPSDTSPTFENAAAATAAVEPNDANSVETNCADGSTDDGQQPPPLPTSSPPSNCSTVSDVIDHTINTVPSDLKMFTNELIANGPTAAAAAAAAMSTDLTSKMNGTITTTLD